MSPLLPVALYGLEVPPGDIMIPAAVDFPATIRITMAAIDPTEEPETDGDGNVPVHPRSTLKLIKARAGDVDDEDNDDDDDDEVLRALLGKSDGDDDDEEEDEDDEPNGGPSDPAKSKKARQEAAIMKLLEATKEDDSDEEMSGDNARPNGVNLAKGKERATDEDDDDDEEDSSDDDGLDLEQFVVCTLDTERNYQQPLDLTVGEGEKVFFVVSGTHTIHLTGNYVIDDSPDSEDDDDDEYDLSPDELDGMIGDSDEEDESDLLDGIDHLDRIKEVDSEDEKKVPKLIGGDAKKGRNKRPAEDGAEGLDEMIAKEAKSGSTEEIKLSKKQLKKLKNNKGEAVAVKEETKTITKETTAPAKSDKKVQFAKNLEQGPTGSAEKAKVTDNASLGVKVVQGVTIDDRKLGTGRAAKSGDKVAMRYIGKLENGKVFDSNKKGTPFSFHLGKGDVIKGWDIGVVGMSVGGERRLTIPANLAYGSKGAPPSIPGNSTLKFDVKLLEIK